MKRVRKMLLNPVKAAKDRRNRIVKNIQLAVMANNKAVVLKDAVWLKHPFVAQKVIYTCVVNNRGDILASIAPVANWTRITHDPGFFKTIAKYADHDTLNVCVKHGKVVPDLAQAVALKNTSILKWFDQSSVRPDDFKRADYNTKMYMCENQLLQAEHKNFVIADAIAVNDKNAIKALLLNHYLSKNDQNFILAEFEKNDKNSAQTLRKLFYQYQSDPLQF